MTDDEQKDILRKNTRFKFAFISFFLLALVFTISFVVAVNADDLQKTSMFLDFASTVGQTLALTVSVYVTARSIFPSRFGLPHNRYQGSFGRASLKFEEPTEEEYDQNEETLRPTIQGFSPFTPPEEDEE